MQEDKAREINKTGWVTTDGRTIKVGNAWGHNAFEDTGLVGPGKCFTRRGEGLLQEGGMLWVLSSLLWAGDIVCKQPLSRGMAWFHTFERNMRYTHREGRMW